MMIAFDVVIIVLLLSCFGFIHSLMASEKIKKFVEIHFGKLIPFYRLFYNIISVLLLYFVYEASPKPPVIVYEIPFPYDLIVYFLQVFSLAGIVWSFSPFDLNEFLGIDQVIYLFDKSGEEKYSAENSSLKVEKFHKYMRHPVYFFSILFMGLRPEMDLFYFTAFVCFSSYFYIGSFYEEKRLIKQFGASYIEYQKRVPRMIPIKLF